MSSDNKTEDPSSASKTPSAPSIEEIKQAAESGDVKSQHRLGVMYFQGDGLECDQAAAYEWFRLAAAQGFAPSQICLGTCYLNGNGIKQSEEDAATWFRTAADSGDPLAQFFLGALYEDGRGVPKSNEQAAFWYDLAAKQQNAEAQCNLGLLYLWGHGVTADTKKAETLLRSAANQGLSYAQNFLGKFWEYGYANLYSPREAAQWYAKSAEQGDADAQCNLGRMIRQGIPVPIPCHDAAERWLRDAYKHLPDSDDFKLESCPEEHFGHDPAEAIKWFSAAAAQGHLRAHALLAEMYEYGEGVAQSPAKAIDLYRKAAEGGDIEAQLKLSEIHRLGRGVKVDNEKAAKWLRLAADASPWGALATGLLSRNEDSLKLAAKQLFALHQSDDFEDLNAPFDSPERFDSALDSVIQLGWPVALVLRGMLYFIQGRMNFAAAKPCFIKAEEAGDPLAAYYLGLMALRGLGETQNQMLASTHFEKCFKAVRHYDDVRSVIEQKRNPANGQVQQSYYDKEFEIWLLGSARSQHANIKISFAREETHKQTLSFLTHTLNNALSTGPETVRTVIANLGSGLYDKDQKDYKTINNMASLFPVFLFAESLLKTFKLYVSDPEQIREKWRSDTAGDANVSLVMAMALRQSVARFVFSSNHLAQLKRLLPNQDKEAIKNIRKSFVDEIIPLEIKVNTAGKVFEWIKAHFGSLNIQIDADAEMSFTSNATRYMFLFAAFSELIYNALKYSDDQQPIVVKWFRQGDDYCFSCANLCRRAGDGQPVQEGTNKGLFFIHKLMTMLEDSTLCKGTENGEYRALLTFGHENFGEEVA